MKRLEYLDVLKGICIVFVVLTHMSWSDSERLLYGFPFWISMAVPVFMILSGYLVSKSYIKRGYKNFREGLAPSCIIPQILRFLLPFFLFLPFEVRYALKKAGVTGFELVSVFLCGGYGPGGYYVCMMFQFSILFPLVWYIVSRWRGYGFLVCFAINMLYEFLQWYFGMDSSIYRVLVFRFLAAISFGVFLADIESDNLRVRIVGWLFLLIGAGYILLNSYFNVGIFFIDKSGVVCLVAALFAMGVVSLWIEKGKCIRFLPLAAIGVASYEIFLFQKIFYLLWARKLFKHVTLFPVQCICSVMICCVIGVLLHRVTSGYFSRFISLVRNRL